MPEEPKPNDDFSFSLLGLDEPLGHRGLYGFIESDDPDSKPLSVGNVQQLIRDYLFTVCDLRGKQAVGNLTSDEALAEVTQAAQNLEDIFYGNVAGWSATNWRDEKGLGYNLAAAQGLTEPAGRVVDLLMYASMQMLEVYDKMLTDKTYRGSEADFYRIADEAAFWFHQVPPDLLKKKA